jgi:Mg2+-importing ATPase
MGQDVDAMGDDELARRAEQATVCARLSPDQKNRVIDSLKKAGHVVGYMGDGINDAPSLRTADVGVSVSNAVDVAREAADIILLEEGLHVLETGIVEGRKTFANTLKYIMMGTSSNFGNMFSVPAALFLVPFLPMQPVQILLNNLLYDFAQVTIPTDRVDDDYISEPRRWDIGFIKRFMIVFGPISSLYDVLTYLVMLYVFHADAPLFQTGWFVESLATQTLVIHVIRSRHSFLKSRASVPLTLSSLAVVAVGFAIPYTTIGRFFGLVPLPTAFFAVLVAMTAAYLGMVSAVKRVFYRKAGVWGSGI